jgi:hypothetical protein
MAAKREAQKGRFHGSENEKISNDAQFINTQRELGDWAGVMENGRGNTFLVCVSHLNGHYILI